MKTLTIWILIGALAASLRWNFMAIECASRVEPHPEQAGAALQCDINPEALGLSEEQSQALESLCRKGFELRQDYEASARSKLALLRQQLSSIDLDQESVRALVREVSKLREAGLGACVDEVLRVRTILDANQIEQLMLSCCPEQSCLIFDEPID